MSRPLFLSLSDYGKALLRMRRVVLALPLLVGLLVMLYLLLRPVTFTAHAIFKGHTAAPLPQAGKLNVLALVQTVSNSFEDPRILFKSYPVLEAVVRKLHLQMGIHEKASWSDRLTPLWRVLQAERMTRLMQKKGVRSPSLPALAPDALWMADKNPPLSCLDMEYTQEVGARLQLTCEGEDRFQVWEGKKRLGAGVWGQPFQWRGGFFTLAAPATPLTSSLTLSFLPIQAATEGLSRIVQCKRSEQHQLLMEVSCTHPDRHMARTIVNAMMTSYQAYCFEEGRRQIAQQLDYLQERKRAHTKELDTILSVRQGALEARLVSGEHPMAQKGLEEMREGDLRKRIRLKQLVADMLVVYRTEPDHFSLTTAEALADIRSHYNTPCLACTLACARRLLEETQVALDQLLVTEAGSAQCLEALSDPDCDPETLSALCTDKTMQGHLAKIHTLAERLLDEPNWSDKERLFLQQELQREKQLLIKAIQDSQTGKVPAKAALQSHIEALKQTMLCHLIREHDQLLKECDYPIQKAQQIPKQWVEERYFDFQVESLTDIISSVTSAIEVNSIDYYARTFSDAPLSWAALPLLPNAPHLVVGCLIGMLLGALLGVGFIIGREIWLGPTASLTNLVSLGQPALPFFHTQIDLKRVACYLQDKGTLGALITDQAVFATDLANLFSACGERVLVIELMQGASLYDAVPVIERGRFSLPEADFKEAPFGQKITLSLPDSSREVFLAGASFHEFLQTQRPHFQRIFLVAQPEELLVPMLHRVADYTVWTVQDQRVGALPELPSVVYLVEQRPIHPLSLKEIVPLLIRTLSFSLRLGSQRHTLLTRCAFVPKGTKPY